MIHISFFRMLPSFTRVNEQGCRNGSHTAKTVSLEVNEAKGGKKQRVALWKRQTDATE